jgi:hypothetical protein
MVTTHGADVSPISQSSISDWIEILSNDNYKEDELDGYETTQTNQRIQADSFIIASQNSWIRSTFRPAGEWLTVLVTG